MDFLQRAVLACEKAMSEGRASENLVSDILKYDKRPVDVSCIEPFLGHRNPMVRSMAARVVGRRGNMDAVIAAALKEEDDEVLLRMVDVIGSRGGGVESLAGLLTGKDSIVRESIIQMFRRLGKTDCLFPLVFDDDGRLVERIKRYLNEKVRQVPGAH